MLFASPSTLEGDLLEESFSSGASARIVRCPAPMPACRSWCRWRACLVVALHDGRFDPVPDWAYAGFCALIPEASALGRAPEAGPRSLEKSTAAEQRTNAVNASGECCSRTRVTADTNEGGPSGCFRRASRSLRGMSGRLDPCSACTCETCIICHMEASAAV